MSHFTHLKTRFKSLIHLEMALANLDIPLTLEKRNASEFDKKDQKYSSIPNNCSSNGFQTQGQQTEPVHLRISPSQIKTLKIDPTCDIRKVTPTSKNTPDIFFKWNGEEYELVFDRSFWDKPYSVEKFISVISEQYVAAVVCAETRKLGFKLIKTKANVDGSQTVTFQRWNKS